MSATNRTVALTINTVMDDPDALWVTEIWADRPTHDAGTHLDSVKAVTRQLMPLLAGPPSHDYGHLVHRSKSRD